MDPRILNILTLDGGKRSDGWSGGFTRSKEHLDGLAVRLSYKDCVFAYLTSGRKKKARLVCHKFLRRHFSRRGERSDKIEQGNYTTRALSNGICFTCGLVLMC
jgi:hypothetical protein